MADPTSGPMRTMLAHMSPTFLSREVAEKWVLGLMGYTGDAMLEASTNAVRAPWLLDETSPQDAVDLQAEETGIDRYPTDTDATHRARVQEAWGAHEFAGTEDGAGGSGEGIEGQLVLLGYPNVDTVANYEWVADSEAATNWSRFWVIIPESDHGWISDGIWSDPGVWDDGGTWDSSASAEEIRTLRRTINDWKAGHEVCAGIIIILEGELWDYPAGTWDEPGGIWSNAPGAIFLSAH